MKPAPSRHLQIVCAIIALIGFLPWGLMLAGTIGRAIESNVPLALSVAAWLVLLVPVWVIWFAVAAWQQRHVSARPAVLMALPAVLVTAFLVTLPALG
jgi:hypothetical protein